MPATAAAGLVLLAFVVLARPSPSVLRAAVMGVLALVAFATGSRKQALPALCAAVLALVLLSPELASQPGFALSTLATAGLLLIAPVWRERLGQHLPGWLAEALAVPVAAQLPCTPVVVAISGQVGLYAVPANLLAVPAVASETVLDVVAALLALLSLPVAQGAAWLAYLATAWLVLVAHVGAPQPGAGLSLVRGWPGTLATLAVIGVAGVVLRSRRLRRVAAAGVVGVLVALLSVAVLRPSWPPPGWVLVSCDVIQGDGFFVRPTERSALVIDNGPDARKMDACLSRLGIDPVPLLVLTHLHADHVEGVPGCCRVGRSGPSRSGRWRSPSSTGNGCSAGSVPGASRSCAPPSVRCDRATACSGRCWTRQPGTAPTATPTTARSCCVWSRTAWSSCSPGTSRAMPSGLVGAWGGPAS